MTLLSADVTLDKPLPQNPEAERSLLGSILINNAAFFRVSALVAVEDFFKDAHRLIFAAITTLSLAGRPVDLITLKGDLLAAHQLEQVGGSAYISSLVAGIPDIANVETYAEIVREAAARRRLIVLGNEIMRRALDIGGDLTSEIATDALAKLSTSATSEDSQAKPLRVIVLAAHKEASERWDSKEGVGLTTGFAHLDFAAAIRRTFMVLAAPSNHGKTSFMIGLADALARHGYSALIASLESRELEIGRRWISMESQVPHPRVQDYAKASAEQSMVDQRRIIDAINVTSDRRMFITRKVRTIDAFYAECRRIQTVHGLDVAFIDYLQLMADSKTDEKHMERIMAGVAQRCLEIAIDLNICVLGLSQLNADAEKRPGGRIHQGDVKWSKAITEQARGFIAFQRPAARDKADKTLRPCQTLFQIEKMNEGIGGVDYEWHFDGPTQTFREGDCEENDCRSLAPRTEKLPALF